MCVYMYICIYVYLYIYIHAGALVHLLERERGPLWRPGIRVGNVTRLGLITCQ